MIEKERFFFDSCDVDLLGQKSFIVGCLLGLLVALFGFVGLLFIGLSWINLFDIFFYSLVAFVFPIMCFSYFLLVIENIPFWRVKR